METNLNLDYDNDLNIDAAGFSISKDERENLENVKEKPPEIPSETTTAPAPIVTDLVALAEEACDDEFFFGWASTYLEGNIQAAQRDIPLIRKILWKERNYWGPKYFRQHGGETAWRKYNGICCALAAIWLVQYGTQIEKVLYYASLAKGE